MGGLPLIQVGEGGVAPGARVTDTRRVVAHRNPPRQVRDTGFGTFLDAPVPASPAPPLCPRVMPVPRPWLPWEIPLTFRRDPPAPTPLEVRPPGVEVSGVPETEAPRSSHWDEQVDEAAASGELTCAPPIVPTWAAEPTDMEVHSPGATAPVGVEPPAPTQSTGGEPATLVDAPWPILHPQNVLKVLCPHSLMGLPAHQQVPEQLLSQYSASMSLEQILHTLGWMYLQHQDTAWNLRSWISEHQTAGTAPAELLQALLDFQHVAGSQ